MDDNERNASNPADDQDTNEAEDRDERPAVKLRRPDEEGGLTTAAPADDDIIIK